MSLNVVLPEFSMALVRGLLYLRSSMPFNLVPQSGYITVVPLKTNEVKEYTGKLLADVETTGMDVLQYGRVVMPGTEFKVGDIVLYPRLASDKTNFGEPRQVIVEVDHVKAYLQETK